MGTKKFYGYKVVVAAVILIMLHNGCTAVYSLFLLDMADHVGCSLAAIGYMSTISLFVSVGASFLMGAGRVVERIGAKKCLYLGTILSALAYVVMGFAPSLTVIYIGVIFLGINISIGTIATTSSLVESWFIERRSEMLGIVIGCALLGSTVLVFVASRINAVAGTYTTTYYVLAAVILIVGVLVNTLLVRTPEQMGQKPLGWEKSDELAKAEVVNENDEEGISLNVILKSFSFWAIMIAVFIFTFAVDSIAIYAPTFFITNGLSEITASNLSTIFLFMGFIGGISAGAIDAKLGHKAFALVLGVLLAVGTALLAFYPSSKVLILAYAAMIIGGLGLQACNQSGPTLIAPMFGRKHYSTLVNYTATASYAGCAAIAPIMNISLNVTGGMTAEYVGCAIGVVVGVVLLVLGLNLSPLKKSGKNA